MLLQQLRDGEHRPDAHFFRRAAGDRDAQIAAEGAQIPAGGELLEVTTQAEAPSDNWLALPAVITPFSRTGLSRLQVARASYRGGCLRRDSG